MTDRGETGTDALKVERDENDQRKEPTVSERVALAEAIAERLQGRQLANLKQNREGNISRSEESGRTRDLAAAKAGLGSGKTLEAAKKVIEKGVPGLVEAAQSAVNAALVNALVSGESVGRLAAPMRPLTVRGEPCASKYASWYAAKRAIWRGRSPVAGSQSGSQQNPVSIGQVSTAVSTETRHGERCNGGA